MAFYLSKSKFFDTERGTPLPQAGEGLGVRVIARPFALLAFCTLNKHPHPRPFSRLREKGANPPVRSSNAENFKNFL